MAGFLSTVTAPALYDQGAAGTARVYSPNNPPPSSTTNTTAGVLAQVRATASLTLTSTATLVPGCTYTLPTSGTYHVTFQLDWTWATGDGPLNGYVMLDGATLNPNIVAVFAASASTRVVGTMSVVFTGTAGQVLTLVALKVNGTGNSTVSSPWTGLTVLLQPSFTVTTTGGGSGGSGLSAVSATSAYTASSGQAVLANGTFAVTLPGAASGAQVTVKNTGTGTVTVTRAGTALIDGASTFPLTTQYSAITVISDGTDWFVI